MKNVCMLKYIFKWTNKNQISDLYRNTDTFIIDLYAIHMYRGLVVDRDESIYAREAHTHARDCCFHAHKKCDGVQQGGHRQELST
jgi:hypothetical protein